VGGEVVLKSYFKKIYEVTDRGDAREESFYSALEGLLKDYAREQGKKKVQITTLPKKTEAGNPDFRVWDGKQHIVGYIEAKDPKIEFLDQIETSEQLKRYRGTFPNLLLTNFFEFRLYRDGELVDRVQIGRPAILHKVKTVPPVENEEQFFKLLERYFSFSLPRVHDARSLAVELAKRTRFLRDEIVAEELKEKSPHPPFGKGGHGGIWGFYEAFRKYLISGLSHEQFADLYSQTVTYGLFAARTRAEGGFNRKLAYDNIPHTIGILRDVFKFVSLGDLPKQMEWIIDDISEVLAVTDVKKLLHRYFHEGKGKDPIIHFYETFLAEYDPATRERRGVYYTPEPVVSYIVRSVNKILKEEFGRKDGLATESVTVLDPAAGTLTFLAEAASLAVNEFSNKYGKKGKEHFIKDHVLKNFYAFELMMAPYAIGHIKMSFLLEELGYRLSEDERCKLYLTNTLELKELEQTALPGMSSLSEESHLAGKIKKEQPILAIIGNPPYSGHSTNVYDEVRAYYQVDGKPLGEKNPKWLQDDYVKFIRFAQWKIDRAGEGILGFITNHSYLDNPTFRGMRRSLMDSFDEIYILDLHGNSLKKEKCPDGSKDENVFDIQQGVAVGIFVKRKKSLTPTLSHGEREQNINPRPLGEGGRRPGEGIVYHADLWGLREKKYDTLQKHDVRNTKWSELKPKSDFYLFVPRDETLANEYEKYWKVTDIFPVNSVGIVTSRDAFAIDNDKEALKRRIRQFRDKNMPDEVILYAFGLKDTSNFNLKDTREKVSKDRDWEDSVTQILYRPFDVRWIFYHDEVIERPRRDVMGHMLQENLGLITVRQVAEGVFDHAYVADSIVESRITLSNKGIAYIFPLYLYSTQEKPKKSRSTGTLMMLFEPQAEYQVKRPNISPRLIEQLKASFKKTPSPEEIFHYIYAILYSETYRTKYAEFLKIDFPRIPFTSDYELFSKLSDLGKSLADLHLMKSPDLDDTIAKFEGKGKDIVEKPRYDADERRVYINETVYFESIPPEVWQYRIGGYQVCDKWLKDRKGKKLEGEFKHYLRIITAIQKTIEVQGEIDEVYIGVEKDTVSIKA
jgi:DNA-binding MarR family transcriptional regulator